MNVNVSMRPKFMKEWSQVNFDRSPFGLVLSLARLFTKLVLEAPIITESALEVIRRYCEDEVSDAARSARLGLARLGSAWLGSPIFLFALLTPNPLSQSRVYLGMTTLKELIVKRPSRQFQYLHVLLDLSSHEKEKVLK